MSQISWQMCDIFEVSNCIRDRDAEELKKKQVLFEHNTTKTEW